jgi:hypothetical protein
MTGRIQELREKLPGLDAEAKALRAERTAVCFPEKDENGDVVLKIEDEALYNTLTARLGEIAGEKAKILNKVARLEELLGPGCLEVPTGYGEVDYVGRLKAELCQFFIHKILETGNGDRYFTLPEVGLQDPRYIAKKN